MTKSASESRPESIGLNQDNPVIPKGRPKGSKGFAPNLRETTSQKVKVKDHKGTRYVTTLQAALQQLANKAATGDSKAARDLFRLIQSLPEGSEQ